MIFLDDLDNIEEDDFIDWDEGSLDDDVSQPLFSVILIYVNQG